MRDHITRFSVPVIVNSQRDVKSALTAETLTLQETLESCYMIKSILIEVVNKNMNKNIQIHCYNDNHQSTQITFECWSMHDQRNNRKAKIEQVTLCESTSQLAEGQTKIGASSCEKLVNIPQRDAKFS